MRTRGFTLIELLVVIGIMGLLGSTAVGGYRAMVRGMEERGVMQNVNAFVRTAYQRAQIDRQPTIVYFWNETLVSKTADKFETVVGRAVAVRRCGRISRRDGSVLVDEFADLDKTYMTEDEQEDSGNNGGSNAAGMELYAVDDLTAGGMKRSIVRPLIARSEDQVQFLGGPKTDESDEAGVIPAYGFVLENENGVSWKQGMAYGFEFLRLDLPPGYIFGSSHSADASQPVVEIDKLVFDAGVNRGTGRNEGGIVGGKSTVQVSALRQQGATLSAVKVNDSDPPDRREM